MKRIPSKNTLFLTGFLILLLAGQGLASGFVLCVGENGRSAFVQAAGDACAPVQPACHADEESSCSACGHDRCGPCDDYTTSLDPLQSRSRADQYLSGPPPSPAAALGSATCSGFLRDLTTNLSPEPPPYPPAALLALRTVVLLN